MFGADIPKVRRFLQGQASSQNAIRFMQKAVPYVAGGAVGGYGVHGISRLLGH
jgi:hypothetical protein